MKKKDTQKKKTFSLIIILALVLLAAVQSYSQTCSLAVSITKQNPTCMGDCDGSITATGIHGSGNYTYQWNTGSTAQTISGLCANTYTVTVTDQTTQCQTTRSVTIQKGRVGSTITVTHASCGECNGAISVQPHGGNGKPYTFLWSTGDTTATITDLCPGMTYTVTITDKLGCTQICRKTVNTSGSPFTLSETIVNNTACPPDNCNGSISVSPSVAGTYSYLWNTGATTSTIEDLCEGPYTVTVTNAGGCSVVQTFQVQDDSNCGNCNGDFTTYTQGGWANPGAPGQYMAANFESCFGSVTIGDACGYTLTLTTVQAVQDFLPQGGQPAALTQNYTDPGSGDITILAGQVLAVAFALGFDDCDPALSGSGSDLGDQVLNDPASPFHGWSIQAIFDTANKVLAGCPSAYSPEDMTVITTLINENYDEGIDNGWFVCPDDFNQVQRVGGGETLTLSAYPNPFSSTITVNVNNAEPVTLTLTDLSGRVVMKTENHTGTVEFDSRALDNGIYFITSERNAFRETIKLLKTN